jgi:hypothetical protein
LTSVVIVVCMACGARGENPAIAHDLAVIGTGVDPRAEAEAVRSGLTNVGYVIGTEISGAGYVAFDARRSADGVTAVRILTSRGIAVALDVPVGEAAEAVTLRRVEGIDDLVVARADPESARDCLVLLRVEEDGRVVQVPIELGRFGTGVCVEDARDVGGDEAIELLTHIRFYALARGETPSIPAVLERRGEGYSPAPPSAHRAFWEGEERRVREALVSARRAFDGETAYARAVELAALERERGGTGARQVRVFDEALVGLVLSEDLARGVAAARQHIVDGWPE